MSDADDNEMPQYQRGQLRPTLAAAGLVLAALMLCTFGLLSVAAQYDGVVSFINPLAGLSCLFACVLITLAPVILVRARKVGRRR